MEVTLGGRPVVRNVMANSYISGKTIDDVMRDVIAEIQANGERIKPSQGWCTEVRGVMLEL
jgi:hypothetical protein